MTNQIYMISMTKYIKSFQGNSTIKAQLLSQASKKTFKKSFAEGVEILKRAIPQ